MTPYDESNNPFAPPDSCLYEVTLEFAYRGASYGLNVSGELADLRVHLSRLADAVEHTMKAIDGGTA